MNSIGIIGRAFAIALARNNIHATSSSSRGPDSGIATRYNRYCDLAL
ncbi:hypothetical protein [Paracoccus litorisediminis]|uniref:Uncharacterized protein n=1 Tax=Paracoccus litorisediminis TaxID=2006130 RepID=A0A844HMY7_9RHOB|nr:hypothetical protein [Paracoccus litorisediminis]MTH61236.1 hypothetical protein [Paracoccus litorisediminis]